MDDILNRFERYFFSVYENSLTDLLLFMFVLTSVFIIKHLWSSWRFRAIRKKIPLVIGGWGTRGKSGTERLKAALFNGLGLSVVSKTTGSEAMFLYGYPHTNLQEMFIYRPYDKATIWEQYQITEVSSKLNVDVYLWECMGLTPAYIEVLQQQWMGDDIATITNTYPDHEDLQGPAGYNIPEVMTRFIPKNSVVLTSEEEMTPILQEAAEQSATDFHTVGWFEAGLIPPDILKRFPYEEHPYNIALVKKLGEILDVPESVIYKTMADNVVEDIGVLKAFPIAKFEKRSLQFINGMSANERFGALSNWQRMKMDQAVQKGVINSVLINNRADRVSRSTMFAKMLCDDIKADRYYLIGSNLSGFVSYFEEAWESFAPSIVLSKEKMGDELRELAEKYRVIYSTELLKNRLEPLFDAYSLQYDFKELQKNPQEYLNGSEHADAIFSNYERWSQELNDYKELTQKMEQSATIDSNVLVREWLRGVITNRIVSVDNYFIKGEELVKILFDDTPSGYLHQCMGMQNIKGPGLDFVYRWMSWQKTYQNSLKLRSKDFKTSHEGLGVLVNTFDYGFLSYEHLNESIEIARDTLHAQTEQFQNDLNLIESSVENVMEELKNSEHHLAEKNSKLVQILNSFLENLLDSGDAIKRRKEANQVYEDLIHQRISRSKATEVLQKIVKRQKGGWFKI